MGDSESRDSRKEGTDERQGPVAGVMNMVMSMRVH